MRINPNDRLLAILLKTMQQSIMPELQTGAAKASAEMMCAILGDLLKREQGTPAVLREVIDVGEALAVEITGHLGIAPAEEPPLTTDASLGALRQRHDDLTIRLTDLCEEFAETAEDQNIVSEVLRKVAEWELSYYVGVAQMPLPTLPSIPPPGVPLDGELLQEFLSQKREPVVVTHFEQLTGGFGKQTFLANVRGAQGLERALVVRKTDPTPIMKHGACNLRSEYDLLKALVPLGYPAPQPQLFCEDFRNIDGSFYTMDRIAGRTPGGYLSGISGPVDESLFLELAALLARLHKIPLAHFSDYIHTHDDPRILDGTVEDCYRYNLEGWRRYIRQEKHLQSPFVIWLLDWLLRNIPKDGRSPLLVHGDFNIHNILAEQGRVTGILDWECAGFGAPEQDLAYIRPHISQHIDWNRFVAHYLEQGGQPINEAAMSFGMVYAALRTVLAGNRGSSNLQSGANTDVRYAMVELGFMAAFMGPALQSAALATQHESTQGPSR